MVSISSQTDLEEALEIEELNVLKLTACASANEARAHLCQEADEVASMHESLNQSGFFTARTMEADLAEEKIEEPIKFEPEVAVCEEQKIEEPVDDFEPGLTFSMIGQKEFTVHESPMIDTCVSNEESPKETEAMDKDSGEKEEEKNEDFENMVNNFENIFSKVKKIAAHVLKAAIAKRETRDEHNAACDACCPPG